MKPCLSIPITVINRMARPLKHPEPLMTRYPEGTAAELDRALKPDETRQDFIRHAVAALIAARRQERDNGV